MPLTGKQRHHLRALAHHLEPVVQVGHEGITPAVLAQVDEALVAHELIKVRIGTESPASREEAAAQIAEGTRSEIAQTIGRIVVVWRRREEQGKKGRPGKKAKIALLPGGAESQKGSKGRPPGQRQRAKAKTEAARAAKRRKLAARSSGARGGGKGAARPGRVS